MMQDRIKALEDALLPFSRMAEAMFARNWNRDGVAVSFVEKDGPVRLTFADFIAAHDALAEIQKTGAGHQRALRITGPNGDGEYWLHIEADGRSGGINLGSDHGPICQRLLDATSQPTPEVRPGAPITLTYTNWMGETAERAIIPRRVWWGSTEWHHEPQWLLTAFDVDKQAERDFALKDFCQPAQPVAVKVKPLVWSAIGDAGAFTAYDPLFERQVLSREPTAYDTERLDRITAALDMTPITVQDAARVLWEAYKELRGKDWKDCTEAERDIKIMDSAALRAITEGK